VKTGIRFGQYELIRRIARGGMAEIYLAIEHGIEGVTRKVVVKRVLPHMAEQQDFIAMFMDEARLATKLTHPNIAHIYNFGAVDGVYFLAMEHVEGLTVSRIIRALGTERIPIEIALRVIADTCAAVHYAHEFEDENGVPLNVVHRDISPQNIMVSRNGAVKLLDFGVARAATQSHSTGVGQLKGKVSYMAPECFWDSGPVDRRADVFSIGVVLHEMVTGKRLYRRDAEAATMAAIIYTDPPPLPEGDGPPELDAIVQRALKRDRDERYPTARELQVELEQLILSRGLVTTPFATGIYIEDLLKKVEAEEPTETPSAPAEVAAHPPSDSGPRSDGAGSSSPSASSGHGAISRPQDGAPAGARRGRAGVVVLVTLLVSMVVGLGIGLAVIPGWRDEGEAPRAGIAAPAEPDATAGRDADQDRSDVDAAEGGAGAPSPRPDGAAIALDADVSGTAEAAPEPNRPEKAQHAARGTLFLRTSPWTNVRIGGRSLGATPLTGVSLPAGTHVLRLVDAEGNAYTRSVRIAPGEATKVYFDLSE